MPPRIIARQLSRPNGTLGFLVGKLMNRYNARINAYALQLLAVSAGDRVLEIGFGGGVNLPSLIADAAFVAGVDYSPSVVNRANARFLQAVASAKAVFREATVEALPFEAASFNKICAMNTIYFWSSLEKGFAEVHRVLAPGGRVVVGFLPKEWMDRGRFPSDIFTPRTAGEVTAALVNLGFQQVRVERPATTTRWNVVHANR
jgi:arsenite methyltransferase